MSMLTRDGTAWCLAPPQLARCKLQHENQKTTLPSHTTIRLGGLMEAVGGHLSDDSAGSGVFDDNDVRLPLHLSEL